MDQDRTGQTLVVFLSRRSGADEAGYAAAAAEMDALAARQPGYRGIESTRGDDGFGITVSFWADEASALAWRAHPRHAAIRELGRARWYDWYEVIVAEASRGYRWTKQASPRRRPGPLHEERYARPTAAPACAGATDYASRGRS